MKEIVSFGIDENGNRIITVRYHFYFGDYDKKVSEAIGMMIAGVRVARENGKAFGAKPSLAIAYVMSDLITEAAMILEVVRSEYSVQIAEVQEEEFTIVMMAGTEYLNPLTISAGNYKFSYESGRWVLVGN
jgi:hypothetical protein